jgi:hypothetical protein
MDGEPRIHIQEQGSRRAGALLAVADADHERAAKSGAVAVQNAVQHPAAAFRSDSQKNEKTPENPGLSLVGASPCDSMPYR